MRQWKPKVKRMRVTEHGYPIHPADDPKFVWVSGTHRMRKGVKQWVKAHFRKKRVGKKLAPYGTFA